MANQQRSPLAVSGTQALKLLRKQLEAGERICEGGTVERRQLEAWELESKNYLELIFGSSSDNVSRFTDKKGLYFIGMNDRQLKEQYRVEVEEKMAILQACASLVETLSENSDSSSQEETSPHKGQSVFVVHGRDTAVRDAVARYVEKLGLETIVLQEQPNRGRTIIEKFEHHASETGFAVVLLTPDDIGALGVPDEPQSSRARQNVIFELGYFMGGLGRNHVALVHKGKVELPSDLAGIVYIPFDEQEGWKLRLARELQSAGLVEVIDPSM